MHSMQWVYQRSAARLKRGDIMTVTHNGKQYTLSRTACRYLWQLVEVGSPRNKVTLNRQQMQLAGLGHLIEDAA